MEVASGVASPVLRRWGLPLGVLLLFGLLPGSGWAQDGEPRGTDGVCQPPFSSDFPDTEGSAHEDNIRCMADHGIAEGRQDGTYAPREAVRRDQMASFIARFIEVASGESLPAGDPGRFDDVPEDSVHAEAINALAEIGVIEGRGQGEYAPREVVRRDAMASFIRRAVSYLDDRVAINGSQPPAGEGGRFEDVPHDSVHAANIESLAGQGIVAGFGDGSFGPRQTVRRDQMASFVMRGYDYAAEAAAGGTGSKRGNADDQDDPPSGTDEQGAGTAWADPEQATITPGVRMVTAGGQCTANFVFTGQAAAPGDSGVYLGYSAHCAAAGEGPTSATNTNGCEAESRDLGTAVDIEGASQPGRLVYSSWLTMNERSESDAATCAFNDFALVAIHPDDHHHVNPTVPFFGGPDGWSRGAEVGQKVHTYGNSSLRLGITLLSPKEGTIVSRGGDGWSHRFYTATPGVPGDSGSAVLDEQGRALASLSDIALAPLAGSNGAVDLGRALRYANGHGDVDVNLARGTEQFRGGLLP